MILLINEVAHELTTEQQQAAIKSLTDFVTAEYEKLDMKYRLLAKPVAREILRKMEDSARKKHGNEEAMKFRPARTIDSVLYLIGIMTIILAEALNHVTIQITTTDHTVTYFKIAIERTG